MADNDDPIDQAESLANFAVIGVILLVIWKIASALGLVDDGSSDDAGTFGIGDGEGLI